MRARGSLRFFVLTALLSLPAGALAHAGEEEDALCQGTADLQSPHFSGKGQARTLREADAAGGSVTTSVIPPVQRETPYPLYIAPQIYPDASYTSQQGGQNYGQQGPPQVYGQKGPRP